MKLQDDASQGRELQEAQRRHAELKGQNDSLLAQVREVAKNYEELKVQVGPILAMAKSRSPGIDEKEALRRLVTDVSRMWPRLEYLKEKTTYEEIVGVKEPPRVRSTFHFRAQYPVALNDVSAELKFNGLVFTGRSSTTKWTFPYGDTIEMQIHENQMGVTTKATNLNAGGTLLIEVVGLIPLDIISMKLSP